MLSISRLFKPVYTISILAALVFSILSESFYIEAFFKPLVAACLIFHLVLVVYRLFFLREITEDLCSYKLYRLLLALFSLSMLISSCLHLQAQQTLDNIYLSCINLSLVSLGSCFNKQDCRFSNKSACYWIFWTLQICFCLIALISLALLVSKISAVIVDGDHIAFKLGLLGGRLWGPMNPNISSICALLSMIAAAVILLLDSKHKLCLAKPAKVFLYFQLVLQVLMFLLMQSRGSLLFALGFILVLLFVYKPGSTAKGTYASSLKATVVRMTIAALSMAALFFASYSFNQAFSVYAQDMQAKKLIVLDQWRPKAFNTQEAIDAYYPSLEHVSPLATKPNEEIYKEQDKKVNKELREELIYQQSEDYENRLEEFDSNGRFQLWKQAVPMIAQRPFFGWGPKSLELGYSNYFNNFQIEHSLLGGSFHNQYLSALASYGMVGSIVLIAFIAGAFCALASRTTCYNFLLPVLAACLGGFLAHAMVESLLVSRMNCLALIFWIILSVLWLHSAGKSQDRI